MEAGEGVNLSFTFKRQSKEKILFKIAQTTMVNRSPVFLDPCDDYKYTNGNRWIGGSSGAGRQNFPADYLVFPPKAGSERRR